MKVLAAVLCMSLLVAVAFAQGANPLTATCNGFCNRTCDIAKQFASLFAVFLGPFIDTADGMCRQGCGFVCGFFG